MQADAILEKVCRSLDHLIEAARPWKGLFPSIVDRRTGQMLRKLPSPIPGQRNGDRSFLGSNLMHDEGTLLTMRVLGEALDRPDYSEAVDRYITRFASHCTGTATGLYPWGEHAYWHLLEDRVGNSYAIERPETAGGATHDHLRQAPLWLWQELHAARPDAVARFADGLDYHWRTGPHEEYCRHAPVEQRQHLAESRRSCDFPRHSGFYIFDLAFAWQAAPRDDLLAQIRRFHDYWWEKRSERGLLLIESRTPAEEDRFYQIDAPSQTLSLATSLLESAQLLDKGRPELAATMRERAGLYIDGFFAAPHDPERGVFVILCHRETGEITRAMPIWGSVYGTWPASYVGLTCLCAWRLTRDDRLLDWSRAVGEAYASKPLPGDVSIPAMDVGMGLDLLADLYDVTGEARWLEAGRELSGRLMPLYLDAPLPCGAAGIDWYESQMGPGFLLHGLARLALLEQNRGDCPLPADYTGR